jgi:hypothetical protein
MATLGAIMRISSRFGLPLADPEMRRRNELPRKCQLDLTNQAWAQRLLAKPIQRPVTRVNPPAAPPKPESKSESKPEFKPESKPTDPLIERIQAEIDTAFEAFRQRLARRRQKLP